MLDSLPLDKRSNSFDMMIYFSNMRKVMIFNWILLLIHDITIIAVNSTSYQYYIPDVPIFNVFESVTTNHVSARGGVGECSLRCLQQKCYTWVYDEDSELCSMYKTASTSTKFMWNYSNQVKLFKGIDFSTFLYHKRYFGMIIFSRQNYPFRKTVKQHI